MDFSYTFRCGSLAHTLLPALHSASCMTASVSRRYWRCATSSILTALYLTAPLSAVTPSRAMDVPSIRRGTDDKPNANKLA